MMIEADLNIDTFARLIMRDTFEILIIDEVHPVLLDQLAEHSVKYLPQITLDELPVELATAQILIMRSKLHLSREWIEQAPELRVIGRLGSGMDNIEIEYAEAKGVYCVNAPEGNRNAVAEQTIGMMLSMLSNVHQSMRQVRSRIWDRKGNQGLELKNLTVGIIGYGNVGSRLGELLSVFGCKVLAYDLFISGFGNSSVEECSLEKIQTEADIVSLHVPLNMHSKKMVNAAFIDKMKKPFFLLNLARGSVVNISDIISGLESEKIKGVALDVLPNEKLSTLTEKEEVSFSYLTDNERVMLTPHIGGLTKDSYEALAKVLSEKVLKWIKMNTLIN